MLIQINVINVGIGEVGPDNVQKSVLGEWFLGPVWQVYVLSEQEVTGMEYTTTERGFILGGSSVPHVHLCSGLPTFWWQPPI